MPSRWFWATVADSYRRYRRRLVSVGAAGAVGAEFGALPLVWFQPFPGSRLPSRNSYSHLGTEVGAGSGKMGLTGIEGLIPAEIFWRSGQQRQPAPAEEEPQPNQCWGAGSRWARCRGIPIAQRVPCGKLSSDAVVLFGCLDLSNLKQCGAMDSAGFWRPIAYRVIRPRVKL